MRTLQFLLATLLFTGICFSKNTQDVRYVVAKSGLNLRETPDIKADIVKTIPFSSLVRVIKIDTKKVKINGRTGHWVQVISGLRKGWVFDAYLQRKKNIFEFDGFFYGTYLYKTTFQGSGDYFVIKLIQPNLFKVIIKSHGQIISQFSGVFRYSKKQLILYSKKLKNGYERLTFKKGQFGIHLIPTNLGFENDLKSNNAYFVKE